MLQELQLSTIKRVRAQYSGARRGEHGGLGGGGARGGYLRCLGQAYRLAGLQVLRYYSDHFMTLRPSIERMSSEECCWFSLPVEWSTFVHGVFVFGERLCVACFLLSFFFVVLVKASFEFILLLLSRYSGFKFFVSPRESFFFFSLP